MLLLLLGFLVMILLFLTGIPIAFSITAVAIGYYVLEGIPLVTLAQRFISGVDSFPLMAAPLFMLTGYIMSKGGSAKRLMDVSNATVGHFYGGLGHVNVVASMIFGGMSGSAIADAAGLGLVELKMMDDAGYDKRFSAAITAASSTIGPIIPPSVPFVIYGCLTNVSIGRLFLGGAIPGIFMGLFLMAAVYWVARKGNFPKEDRFSFRRLLYTFKDSMLELLTPVIIIGGIVTGVFTPTEAAIVAVAYGLFLEVVIRREITLRQLPALILEMAKLTGTIMFILASCQALSWILVREQAGDAAVTGMLALSTNPNILLLLLLAGLILLGCFLDPIAGIILCLPVVTPLANHLALDPVHLGVVLVLALMIGVITPPVGYSMYIVCAIVKINMWEFTRAIYPFIIALVLALITIGFFPSLTLWLPKLVFG